MEKITTITPKQEAKIPEYIEKWTNLASQPINFQKAAEILKSIFQEPGKEEPLIFYCETLTELLFFINGLTKGKEINFDDRLYARLDARLDARLRDRLNARLYARLDARLRDRLNARLNPRLYARLYARLDARLHDRLNDRLDARLDARLHDRLHARLHDRLHARLHDRLDARLDTMLKEEKITWSKYILYYFYDWAGYYDYVKYIGVNFNEKELQEFNDILLNLPITIFLGDRIIFVLEKPLVKFEDERLHCETAPAIGWKDGSGFYFLNDIYLEKKMFDKIINKKLTAKQALALHNVDQRALALKYLGWDKVIKELGAKKISQDEYGELYEIDLKDDDKPAKFFKAIDPSTNEPVFERVHPSCQTPKESQMRHYRLDIIQADYSNFVRT